MNGWKGVCVYHKTNGNKWMCPVHALAHCYIHLCTQDADLKTFLSVYYEDCGKRSNITNEDISRALKAVATVLEYSIQKIFLSTKSTHSPYKGGVQMPCPWQATRTSKSRRWGGGVGLHLKYTSGKN
jgi:hypothetical protein